MDLTRRRIISSDQRAGHRGFSARDNRTARRTSHLRFNHLTDPEPVPLDTDFASVIKSNHPMVAQHTRLDSRQAEFGLLSTHGHRGRLRIASMLDRLALGRVAGVHPVLDAAGVTMHIGETGLLQPLACRMRGVAFKVGTLITLGCLAAVAAIRDRRLSRLFGDHPTS